MYMHVHVVLYMEWTGLFLHIFITKVQICRFVNVDLYKLEVYLFESVTITASRKILC